MRRLVTAAIFLSSVFGSTHPTPRLASKLVSVGSSYAIEELNVGGHSVGDVIVDTGSSDLVVVACGHPHQGKHCYPTNNTAPVSSLASPCVTLVEDGRDSITYLGCFTEEATVKLYSNAPTESDSLNSGTAVARSSPFIVASSVNLTSRGLHPWEGAGGLLGLAGVGLAQHTSTEGDTLFTQLVRNGSASLPSASIDDKDGEGEPQQQQQQRLLAGLDFRAPILEASVESVMHLGGVSSAYPLQWSEPSTEAALDPLGVSTFHSLRLHFPSFCGAPLLGGESSSWPAIVDTGSDCLVRAWYTHSWHLCVSALWFEKSSLLYFLAILRYSLCALLLELVSPYLCLCVFLSLSLSLPSLTRASRLSPSMHSCHGLLWPTADKKKERAASRTDTCATWTPLQCNPAFRGSPFKRQAAAAARASCLQTP